LKSARPTALLAVDEEERRAIYTQAIAFLAIRIGSDG
jgi:hypothetical protein